MSKPKKPKFQPVLIVSKDGMIATLNTLVADKLSLAEQQVAMEQEVAEIHRRYQKKMEPLARDVAAAEAGLQVYVTQHREELFPKGVKSLDFTNAVIGFRDTPHRVDKARSKDTWDEIALRMACFEDDGVDGGVQVRESFHGEHFVRYAEPALDKQALLAARADIPPGVLTAVGIKFAYDELFYIDPKSEVIEGKKEVAA